MRSCHLVGKETFDAVLVGVVSSLRIWDFRCLAFELSLGDVGVQDSGLRCVALGSRF